MNKFNFAFALMGYLIAAGNPCHNATAEGVAQEVVNALRSSSSQGYAELFPTIEEFHHLMEIHRSSYGSYLTDAQSDFDAQYRIKILPELVESFESLLKQGKERGIVWSEVQFSDAKLNNRSQRLFDKATLSITMSHRGTIHRIVIEDALLVNSRWCVGRSIRFA